eukprot:3950993-Lingulodinium_polyedra.AAC.1
MVSGTRTFSPEGPQSVELLPKAFPVPPAAHPPQRAPKSLALHSIFTINNLGLQALLFGRSPLRQPGVKGLGLHH